MRRGRVLLLLFLAAAAGGCAVADTGAFVRLQEDMEAQKKEIALLRREAVQARPAPAPANVRPEPGEIPGLQRNVADLSNDMARMKSDLLQATTRLDDTKVELQKEISRLNGKTDEQAQAIQEIRTRVARIPDIEKRLAAAEEKLEKGPAAGPAPAPAAAGAAAADWKTPEEMYDYALGRIKGGDPRKGREVLAAFAAKYPDHKLMPNVHYWKGESFYAEKDYENAILAFQDVIDKYSSSEKAPDAMFKQGLSFLAMKDTKNGKLLLELVSTKYPKASVAAEARKRLDEIK